MNQEKKNMSEGLVVILVILLGLCALSEACDTWVAAGCATKDGAVILGKNSDRLSPEAQPLVYMPRTKHTEKMVKCSKTSIPQVAETYEHFGSPRKLMMFGQYRTFTASKKTLMKHILSL